jgi:hypothetical protein
MNRTLLFAFIVVLISACSPSPEKKILPPIQMQSLLWDVMRADELAAYYAQKDTGFSDMQKYTDYYQDILQIHDVSKLQFRTSLKYYLSHPDEFKPILDSLQSFAEKAQQHTPYVPAPSKKIDTLQHQVSRIREKLQEKNPKPDTNRRKKLLPGMK